MFWKEKKENFMGQYKIDQDLCVNLIKFYKKQKNKKPGVLGDGIINESTKKSIDYTVDADDFIKHKIIKEYFEELSFCLNKYKKKYFYSDEGQKSYTLEGANIQKYKPGEGFYNWHYENNGTMNTSGRRHLVFMTYLNNVKDGGTNFFYQNLTTKAKTGSTLIWPAAWTHTHRGQISKKQDKYIITGWWWYV